MNTVLLVDDEPAVLESLQKGIVWENFGVDTLLTAACGQEALVKMEHFHVDLLITDIQMPHMDGITLLREIRMKYPYVRCILLTAFSKFEYAREAVSLGVENYLLKPFCREELEATIERALDNIFTTKEISDDLFRNNILFRWAADMIRSEELSERSGLLGINTFLPEYCIVCVQKKQPGSLSPYYSGCFSALSSRYEVQSFLDRNNRKVFIVGGRNLCPEEILKIFTSFARTYGVEALLVLSIGAVVYDAGSLHQSYQGALRQLDAADLSVSGMQTFLQESPSTFPDDLLADELGSLFRQESEGIRRKGYESVADKLLPLYGTDSGEAALFVLAKALRQLFRQVFPDEQELIRQLNDRLHLFPSVPKEGFQDAVCELLEYSYLLFCYYLNRFTPVVGQAVCYIHQHYAENISINEFCIRVKTNPAYLGSLFRKETGLFFNTYLNQYRICRSIRLLLNTDMKINDIASQVGFASVTYFLTSFKKKAGMTPAKYRIFHCDSADRYSKTGLF